MRSVNLSMALDWAHAVSMVPSLRVLDLSDCSLASANQSLPHLNLTQVERLDLSLNDFNHPVATCWVWNLTSLTYLGLGGTQLYGKFHHALGGMTSLQVLDFFGSSGTRDPYITDGGLDIMTANMTNLCNLQILILSSSDMNGDITEFFEHLPQCSQKLKELHLDNNDFTGVIPNWIGGWASLVILDLSNNQINGSVPSEIGALTSLLTLDLSNNQITGLVPSEISKLNNLTSLKLGWNNLSGVITQEILAGLTSLWIDL
jgi:Leucine-rich repeat (LRR) protein